MNLFDKILLKIKKRKFVRNLRKGNIKKRGHALIYYKTEPFASTKLVREYAHPNNWEVLEIARTLNEFGFWVDVIDRTADIGNLKLEDKYDIFIGIGAGNSGRYYPEIASSLKKAVKIFYAAGPDPDLSLELTKKRYEYFFARHPGEKADYRRLTDKVDIKKCMAVTDVIFCFSGNDFSLKSYMKYGKDIYKLYLSTSPYIKFDLRELELRSRKKFLYFGGNGNIVKGLDLVIEVFAKLPELELYICAPKDEEDFNHVYEDIISRSKNIHFIGFVKVGDRAFNSLTAICGHVILLSCSEGIATSVTTCMRKGLIPVITGETGIDVKDFGYIIKDIDIDAVASSIKKIAAVPRDEFMTRAEKSYKASSDHTQEKFTESLKLALKAVLSKKGKHDNLT